MQQLFDGFSSTPAANEAGKGHSVVIPSQEAINAEQNLFQNTDLDETIGYSCSEPVNAEKCHTAEAITENVRKSSSGRVIKPNRNYENYVP